MKKPSAETENRTLRRQVRELRKEAQEHQQRVVDIDFEVRKWRGCATKAEVETAEWKRRFDRLLWSTGKLDAPDPELQEKPE